MSFGGFFESEIAFCDCHWHLAVEPLRHPLRNVGDRMSLSAGKRGANEIKWVRVYV